MLTGPVSPQLENLQKLQSLLLNGNHLEGGIPSNVAGFAFQHIPRFNFTQATGGTLCGPKVLNLPVSGRGGTMGSGMGGNHEMAG